MSKFYGTVVGQAKTPATRCGSKKSGIRTAAQSYDGSVITELSYDNESNELMVEIEVNDGTSMFGRTIFRGTFNEFIEKLR